MKVIEYFEWRLHDELRPKRTYLARWKMTEADALAHDPLAEKAPGAGVARCVADTEEEKAWGQHLANHSHGFTPDKEVQHKYRAAEDAAWAEYRAAGGKLPRNGHPG